MPRVAFVVCDSVKAKICNSSQKWNGIGNSHSSSFSVSAYINKRFWAFAAGSTGSLSLRCDIIQNIVMCMRNSFQTTTSCRVEWISSNFYRVLFCCVFILYHFDSQAFNLAFLGTDWNELKWAWVARIARSWKCEDLLFPFLGLLSENISCNVEYIAWRVGTSQRG